MPNADNRIKARDDKRLYFFCPPLIRRGKLRGVVSLLRVRVGKRPPTFFPPREGRDKETAIDVLRTFRFVLKTVEGGVELALVREVVEPRWA